MAVAVTQRIRFYLKWTPHTWASGCEALSAEGLNGSPVIRWNVDRSKAFQLRLHWVSETALTCFEDDSIKPSTYHQCYCGNGIGVGD